MGWEQYYPGDDEWEEFVNIFAKKYKDENAYQLAQLLDNKLDVAIVIYGQIGGLQGSIDWISRKVPVLENLRPIDCLENDVLIKRLKTALMRMP